MIEQYLERYAESEASQVDSLNSSHWEHCLVVPVYRESAQLLEKLRELSRRQAGVLILLVINQPDDDPDPLANADLLEGLKTLRQQPGFDDARCYALEQEGSLLVLQRESALPKNEGVGLARKIGCDVALALIHKGVVSSNWIHCSDADATLPDDYFAAAERHSGAAISHPFRHTLPDKLPLAQASYLYELRLHYYVEGLKRAGSPYAFHTLGSCVSVSAAAYASVRGMPRRAGGEDFYLLNKVAKLTTLGDVVRPAAPEILLESRASARVPFGTGPAVSALLDDPQRVDAALFYHPESFVQLGHLLGSLDELRTSSRVHNLDDRASQVLLDLGLEQALAHCQRQSSELDGWLRHFHQWFDGFRTLKFIHGLREQGLGNCSLAQTRAHPASPWPENWVFQEALLQQQSADIAEQ